MEFMAIVLIVAAVVWVLWRTRAKHRAKRRALLHKAWHVVLEDPEYKHRRLYEERIHDYEEQARKESDNP